MAVQYVEEKNNLMGALGHLATFAGAATGQPWLAGLGTGLDAYQRAMDGDDEGRKDLQDILTNFGKTVRGWFKPTDGNIAKVREKISPTAEKIANIANRVKRTGTTPSVNASDYLSGETEITPLLNARDYILGGNFFGGGY